MTYSIAKIAKSCQKQFSRAFTVRGGKTRLITTAVARMAPSTQGAPQAQLTVLPQDYPKVERQPVVEELHGVQVADPYRWLEDPDAKETQAFVEAQNQLTQKVLSQCATKEQFKELFKQIYDYEKFGTPFKRGSRYYYYHNTGLQQQHVLFGQDSLTAPPVVLLDPNSLSEDGTVALKDASFSDDGSLLAYSLSSGGSDWATIQVLGVGPDGCAVPHKELLEHVKFSSLEWTHDNKGFFYNKYPEVKASDLGTETDTNTNQQLCYHILGTPQDQDVVVLADPQHPLWMFGAEVTDDGRYLIIYVSEGCRPQNRLYYLDLTAIPRHPDSGALDFSSYDFFKGDKALPMVKLIDSFDASWGYVANDEEAFTFKTNLDAPRYRVVRAQLSAGSPPSSWPDIIPQHPRDLLQSAVALKGDELVIRWLRDVKSALCHHKLSSGELLQEFQLPGIGSVSGLSATRKSKELFFSFTSFTEPGATYRVDLAEQQSSPQLFRKTMLRVDHNADDYVTTQVFVPSKDGTKVPMFITHKKGLKLDGNNPTLLYGYGGFNISLEPGFSASRLAWLRGYGGVYAQANLRGGGEYGIEWRDAGSKANKQNVFDDFQACAQYLSHQGYCQPDKLVIQGGSNGGLLVAACINQRPDVFCCGLAQVGVMDMLRFHKFTIGHAWCTDYGDPDQPEDFKWIYPYSPLHNVAVPQEGSQQYPAILLATGDHDDRVVPLHSLKLISELQYQLAARDPDSSKQRNPLLIRVEVRAGHGAGKPTAKIIAETADLIGFAAQCVGAQWVGGSTGDAAAASTAASSADKVAVS